MPIFLYCICTNILFLCKITRNKEKQWHMKSYDKSLWKTTWDLWNMSKNYTRYSKNFCPVNPIQPIGNIKCSIHTKKEVEILIIDKITNKNGYLQILGKKNARRGPPLSNILALPINCVQLDIKKTRAKQFLFLRKTL